MLGCREPCLNVNHMPSCDPLDDYETAIEPDVEAIIKRHAKLRLILHLDDNFEGFGDGAWGSSPTNSSMSTSIEVPS
jgi:hypothetical protein